MDKLWTAVKRADVFPALQAEALGARVSYVLPSIGPSDSQDLPDGGAAPVALRALGQLLGRTSATEIAAARGQVHVLPAPRLREVNPFDFRSTTRLIAEGEHLTRDWLQRTHPLPADHRAQQSAALATR